MRQKKRRGARRGKRGPAGNFPMTRVPIIRPTRQLATVMWRNLAVLNNVGAAGANVTIPLYLVQGLTPVATGVAAYFSAAGLATPAIYLSARLLSVRVKCSFTNQETFGIRVATVLCGDSPANNSLLSLALQQAWLSKASNVVRDKVIGPLTGQSMTTLSSVGSLRRTLGITPLRGLNDATTNYWDNTTSALVSATSGLSLIVLATTPGALSAGVLVDYDVEMVCEFFTPNPDRTT
jgi:hypothetical protein